MYKHSTPTQLFLNGPCGGITILAIVSLACGWTLGLITANTINGGDPTKTVELSQFSWALFLLGGYFLGVLVTYICCLRVEIIRKIEGDRPLFGDDYPPIEFIGFGWPLCIPIIFAVLFAVLSHKFFKKIALKIALIGVNKTLIATDPDPEVRKLLEK